MGLLEVLQERVEVGEVQPAALEVRALRHGQLEPTQHRDAAARTYIIALERGYAVPQPRVGRCVIIMRVGHTEIGHVSKLAEI